MGLYDKKIILPRDVTKFNYIDKLVDDIFKVDTLGNSNDTKNADTNLYNYLPTPYAFFEELFTKYPFNDSDHFVDIGCGKGRALMMAALFGCRHIIGIEINDNIYRELMNNYLEWEKYQFMNEVETTLINKSCLDVKIENEWNKFFMFKPFNNDVFREVILNIYNIKRESNKTVYIYLYHPDKNVIEWIEKENLFYLIEKDVQITENSNGLVKRKIRSIVYSNHSNVVSEKTYWRY